MNRELVKAFNAGGAIASNTLVKFGSDDDTVVAAAAASDSVIGAVGLVAAPGLGAVSGDRVDVQIDGIADVKAGAAVTRGALLIADASGRVITATATTGSNVRTVGVALASATAANDIIPVQLAPGSFQG